MKKLLYLFCASLLVLASCSGDDDNSTTDPALPILPKTVRKYIDPSEPSSGGTYRYVFDGNKIVSVSSDGSRREYTYDGNVIVKIIHYVTDMASGKEWKYEEESYTYANNKLATSSSALDFSDEYPSGQFKQKTVYTYNSDGTVKGEKYNINAETGIETKNSITVVFTFINGNLVKQVDSATTSESSDIITIAYEYDSKNNPFKNVLGLNLLLYNSSVNNIVQRSYFQSSQWGVYNSEIITKYVYDANGYPTKEIFYKEDGTTVNYINEYTY